MTRRLYGITLLLLAACGGATPRIVASEEAPPVTTPSPTSANLVHRLGDVNRPSMGPYRTVGTEGSLLVYVVSADEGAQIIVQALFPDGAPKGQPRPLGIIPFETRALVVKPLGKGFIVCYTSPVGENDAILGVVLDEGGKAIAPATEIVKTPSPIGWFEVVPNKTGVVTVWAETTASENASIFAVAMDTRGSVISAPSRVGSHAVSWHLHESDGALVLGSISAVPQLDVPKRAPGALVAATGHTITLQQIDIEGRAAGAAIVVANGRQPSRDLDFADVGAAGSGQTRVVWTELDGGVPRPMHTVVDHRVTVSPPEVVESAKGGGRVLSLTHGILMWRGPVSANRVYLTDLSKPQDLRWSFDADDGRPPEFVPATDGYALLGFTRLCPQTSSSADACDRLPKKQTLARFGADLTLKETSYLAKTIGDNVEPALAWALHCGDKECSLLTATGASKMQLSSVRIPNGSTQKSAAPASSAGMALRPASAPNPEPPATAPTQSSLATGRIGPPTSVLPGFVPAAFSTPEGRYLAVIGEREGVKKGPQDDAEIVILSTDGAAAEVASITKRALARGGVALAQGATPKDGYALVWVALEQGDPEVHVSHLDKTGHRISDTLLTTVKGEARDVTVRWVGDGYMVAWIDGRDGVLEVYATKLNAAFERITRQTRITNGPGDASDLAMLRGEGPKAPLFLSWVKPGGPVASTGVYVTRISAHNSERVGNEVRLLSGSSVAHRPYLSPAAGGSVAITWLEDEAGGRATMSDQAVYTVSMDSAGKLEGAPLRLLSLPNARAATLLGGREGTLVSELQEGTQSSIIELRLGKGASASAVRLVPGLASKKRGVLAASKSHVWYADPRGAGVLRAPFSNEP